MATQAPHGSAENMDVFSVPSSTFCPILSTGASYSSAAAVLSHKITVKHFTFHKLLYSFLTLLIMVDNMVDCMTVNWTAYCKLGLSF